MSFRKDLIFGKVGEMEAMVMLISRGWTVEDKSEEKLDYDFIIKRNDVELKVEVKRQSSLNEGRVCLEIDQPFALGWFMKTDADKIIFTYKGRFVIIDTADLRDVYNTRKPYKYYTYECKQICFMPVDWLVSCPSYQEFYIESEEK